MKRKFFLGLIMQVRRLLVKILKDHSILTIAKIAIFLGLLTLPKMASAESIEGIWAGSYRCGSGSGHMEVVTSIHGKELTADVVYNFGQQRGYFQVSGPFSSEDQTTLLNSVKWIVQPPGHQAPNTKVRYLSASEELTWRFTSLCTPVKLARASKMVRLVHLPENIASVLKQKIERLPKVVSKEETVPLDLPNGIWVLANRPTVKYRQTGSVMTAVTPMGLGRKPGTVIFKIEKFSREGVTGQWYHNDLRWRNVSGQIEGNRLTLRNDTGIWSLVNSPSSSPIQDEKVATQIGKAPTEEKTADAEAKSGQSAQQTQKEPTAPLISCGQPGDFAALGACILKANYTSKGSLLGDVAPSLKLEAWKGTQQLLSIPQGCAALKNSIYVVAEIGQRKYGLNWTQLPETCEEVLKVARVLAIEVRIPTNCINLRTKTDAITCLVSSSKNGLWALPLREIVREDVASCSSASNRRVTPRTLKFLSGINTFGITEYSKRTSVRRKTETLLNCDGLLSFALGSGPINFAPSVCQIFSLARSICARIVVLFQADVPQTAGKSVKPEGRQFHFISTS
jgi:hypothetical protein